MTKDLPLPDLMRKLLRYEPDTGKLFWRERPESMFTSAGQALRWNNRHAGTEALRCATATGCLHGNVLYKNLLAHRAAWSVHYGQWPQKHIDHINGDRSDNKISNLRDVSHAENTRNAKRRSDNSSGYAGVYKYKNRWIAHIKVDGKCKVIGRFDGAKEAAKFREKEKLKYGYHENHGRE